MKRGAARQTLLRAALASLLCAGGAQAYTLTDDGGHTTAFDTPPQRIVSLLPSLTETVCALGACDRLVGVDRYSNWPTAVQKLPRAGGGLDPNIEAVVALRPDVVLLATSTRVTDRLRALGLKVMALEPKSRGGARRVATTLGVLLQRGGEAEQLLKAIDTGVAEAAAAVPPAQRGLRVYFEVGPAPHAAGPQSFVGETLQALGLGNVIGPELGPFPKINPELVVRADPDLIMAGEGIATRIADRPGWARLRAVREGRVCLFKPEEIDILVRPGPRLAEAARLMLRCVRDKGAKAAR